MVYRLMLYMSAAKMKKFRFSSKNLKGNCSDNDELARYGAPKLNFFASCQDISCLWARLDVTSSKPGKYTHEYMLEYA